MTKYRLIFQTEDELILIQETDNEPPHVGELLDLSEFGVAGNFMVKGIQHQPGSTELPYIAVFIEKNEDDEMRETHHWKG